MLPFTPQQFFRVFENYNEAVWPSQLVLVGASLIAVLFAAWKRRWTDPAICLILAGFWLWMGLVYHIGFFSSINPAAVVFGCLSVAQGLLFLYAGPARKRLSFAIGKNWSTVLGASLLLYAMLIYPLLGLAFGHVYPRQPTFGVPCPTTIFTFGLLLWTDRPVLGYLLVIPAVWAVIGSSAAFLLGVWQDLGLFVAGVAGVVGVLNKDATSPAPA